MRQLRGRLILPVLFFLLAFLIPFTLNPSDPEDIDALAPAEVVARGLREPFGIAVDQSGAVFVSDRKGGEILKITGGTVQTLLTRLRRPVGLSFDPDGRLLIVEEGSGSLLRLEQDGGLTVLAHGMKEPRWIAVAEGGTIYLSAKGLKSEKEESREEKEEDEEFGQVILRLGPDRQLSILVDVFEGLEGLEVRDGALFAAAKTVKSGKHHDGIGAGVFHIPLLADGSAGPVTGLTQTRAEIEKPVGLALDGLGALYVSGEEIEFQKKAKNAIAKIAFDSAITRLASRLKRPRGMAFDGLGNLYVADGAGEKHGRVVRLRAPPPPNIIVPSFTNQSLILLNGTSEASSRIDTILNDTPVAVSSSDESGAFLLTLNLALNRENSLTVFATSHLGQGLVSGPGRFTFVHDNTPPLISNLEPLSGSYLNTSRPVIRADFSDNLSGVDVSKVQIQLDGNNVTPQAQISASGFSLDPLNPLSLNLFPLAEGSRTASVTIFDRAGNATSASTTLTVDITPPDALVVSGPEGTISATSALFTFTGTDNLTPVAALQFAWRLDAAPFSAFSSQTQVSFSGLTPGPHTFEVKVRDLAGNEDPSPATRSFTISTLQVRITEPGDGATVSAGSLLVRGTVEAGGGEVGVAVNGVPAAVQGSSFAVLIQVTPDMSKLFAVATTAVGATASHSSNVSVLAAPVSAFALFGSPGSGIAPLTVNFSVSGPTPATVELDLNGDRIVEFIGPSITGQSFTYTQPGIYVPTATMTDAFGNRLTANAVIQVFDRGTLDLMLQGKWTAMKAALGLGDIQGAVTFIADGEKGKYLAAFERLGADLSSVSASLNDITPVTFQEGTVEYATTLARDGGIFIHFVYFMRDQDGIWKIVAM